MRGTIQNREEFLDHIAMKLGKDKPNMAIEKQTWSYQPQDKVLKGTNQDELLEILKKQCESIHTDIVVTSKAELLETVRNVVIKYGGGPVVAWRDARFKEFGLFPFLQQIWQEENVEFHEWDYQMDDENIVRAEKANIGITISDITLAESGTAVLFSSKDRGRTVSFLPITSIIIIPKSTIVTRLTQAARILRDKVKTGEQIPSCVNFITGPSNSADIESKLVVGVHGPVRAAYLVVEDL